MEIIPARGHHGRAWRLRMEQDDRPQGGTWVCFASRVLLG